MVQASITVSGSELTADLLEKIKTLIQGESRDFEVTISVKPKETQEPANIRINRSIENIERRKNMVAFSPDEYNSLVKQISS